MTARKFTDDDIIKYNLEVLPKVRDIEPVYSIVARARRHSIKAGDNIDIEIYLTGLGIPDTNKVVLLWSSPNIIDASSPGYSTYCIRDVEKKINGKDVIFPLAGKEVLTRDELVTRDELASTGIELLLTKGYFLPTPDMERRGMAGIVAERNFEGYPPILVSLKTLRKAQSGASSIDVTFTYRHRNIIKQASDRVEFHVTSLWDRNQGWILTVGVIAAVAAFVLLVRAAIVS